MNILYKVSIFILTLFCVLTASAHWTSKGPYGGKVSCLHVADTIVYVGTKDGGLYRSTTAAANAWRYVNYTNFNDPQVNAITSIGTSVFIGTPSGILVSVDKGATWVSVNNNIGSTNILSLAVSGTTLFAGTDNGVYMSLNLGVTWTAQSTGLINLHVNDLFVSQGIIYAGTYSGIYSKSIAAAMWTSLNGNIAEANVSHIAVIGNTIVVSTPSTAFYSDLSLINWKPTGNLPGYLVNDISVDETSGTFYVSASTGVYSSTNATLWIRLISGLEHEETTSTVVYANKLYTGSPEDGIYRSNSTSLVSWASHNNGFNNLQANFVYNNGLLVIAATNKGLYISKDLAANYVKASLPDPIEVTGVEVVGSTFYISTKNAGVFYSTDSGSVWTSAQIGEDYIVKIIASSDMLIAAGLSGKIYYTLMPTFVWFEATGLPENGQISALAVKDNNVYAAVVGFGVYHSPDAASFTSISTSLPTLSVSSLAIHDNYLFAGTLTNGVFRRALIGSTWTEVNTGISTSRITALTSSGRWVVAGFKGGIIVSYNNGESWQEPEVQQYIPTFSEINNISFTTNSSRVFVSTPHNSVYSNAISELPTFTGEITLAKLNFTVQPNPAYQDFVVNTGDLVKESLDLQIFDISGRIVQEEKLPEFGQNQIKTSLAPGTYLIKLSTKRSTGTKKLIIQ